MLVCAIIAFCPTLIYTWHNIYDFTYRWAIQVGPCQLFVLPGNSLCFCISNDAQNLVQAIVSCAVSVTMIQIKVDSRFTATL